MSKLKISRKNFVDNPVIVVDGAPGSGKGIISRLLAYFNDIEMYREKTEFEVICSLFSIGGVDLDSAKFFIQAVSDQDIYHQSILRHSNAKPGELSSISKYPGKLEYLKRFFSGNLQNLEQKFISDNKIMNYCIHNMTSCIEPMFKALNNRLIYVRVIRSPFSEYMLKFCSQWSARWENDYKNNMPILEDEINTNLNAPFFIRKEDIKLYSKKNYINKAAMSICAWQQQGDKHLQEIQTKYDAEIIEIPFEIFVTNPMIYLNKLSLVLNQVINKNIIKFLKKEHIPRDSLSDAPFSNYYFKNGWKKPTQVISPLSELALDASKAKDMLDEDIYEMMEDCSKSYYKKYDLNNLMS